MGRGESRRTCVHAGSEQKARKEAAGPALAVTWLVCRSCASLPHPPLPGPLRDHTRRRVAVEDTRGCRRVHKGQGCLQDGLWGLCVLPYARGCMRVCVSMHTGVRVPLLLALGPLPGRLLM